MILTIEIAIGIQERKIILGIGGNWKSLVSKIGLELGNEGWTKLEEAEEWIEWRWQGTEGR